MTGEEHRFEAPHYAIFSSLLLLSLSYTIISSSATYSRRPSANIRPLICSIKLHTHTERGTSCFSLISNSILDELRDVCFDITDMTSNLWRGNFMSATKSSLLSSK
jgi:hypothetical protein